MQSIFLCFGLETPESSSDSPSQKTTPPPSTQDQIPTTSLAMPLPTPSTYAPLNPFRHSRPSPSPSSSSPPSASSTSSTSSTSSSSSTQEHTDNLLLHTALHTECVVLKQEILTATSRLLTIKTYRERSVHEPFLRWAGHGWRYVRETKAAEEEEWTGSDEDEDAGCEAHDEADDLYALDVRGAVQDPGCRTRARSHWRRSAACGSGVCGGSAAKCDVLPYRSSNGNGNGNGIGNRNSNTMARAPSVGSSIYSTVPHRHVNVVPAGETGEREREREQNYEHVAKRAALYKKPAATVREVGEMPVIERGRPNDAVRRARQGVCEE